MKKEREFWALVEGLEIDEETWDFVTDDQIVDVLETLSKRFDGRDGSETLH